MTTQTSPTEDVLSYLPKETSCTVFANNEGPKTEEALYATLRAHIGQGVLLSTYILVSLQFFDRYVKHYSSLLYRRRDSVSGPGLRILMRDKTWIVETSKVIGCDMKVYAEECDMSFKFKEGHIPGFALYGRTYSTLLDYARDAAKGEDKA